MRSGPTRRSLAGLVLALAVVSPGLAGPAPGATAERLVGTRHDATTVARVDVRAVTQLETGKLEIRAKRRSESPAGPAPSARPRSDGPVPNLVLGPAADPPARAKAPATGPAAPFHSAGFAGMNDTVNGFLPGCGGVPRPCVEPPDPWVARWPPCAGRRRWKPPAS